MKDNLLTADAAFAPGKGVPGGAGVCSFPCWSAASFTWGAVAAWVVPGSCTPASNIKQGVICTAGTGRSHIDYSTHLPKLPTHLSTQTASGSQSTASNAPQGCALAHGQPQSSVQEVTCWAFSCKAECACAFSGSGWGRLRLHFQGQV